jgi:hypothetical protein
MCIDFRKHTAPTSATSIRGQNIEIVEEYKYLLLLPSLMTENNFWKCFPFNESDEKEILLSLEQAQIHAFCVKKRRQKRGRRSGILLRSLRRASKLPMPSILLANVKFICTYLFTFKNT